MDFTPFAAKHFIFKRSSLNNEARHLAVGRKFDSDFDDFYAFLDMIFVRNIKLRVSFYFFGGNPW